MSVLENAPVEIRFFQQGSVENVDTIVRTTNLAEAVDLVRRRFPEATLVPCCENEPDGGCVFVYPNPHDQTLDAKDAATAGDAQELPDQYGRWIGVISMADSDQPTCAKPRSHL